jgi:hypothetical protein
LGDAQLPQLSVPPHLSLMLPQFFPSAAHEVGVQPQTLGTPPPPQLALPEQPPQSIVPPH